MRPDSRDPILGTAWGKPLPPYTPVFFYARTSSDKQEEMVTIAAQLDEQKAFAERMGITWSETFLDDGVTGDMPLSLRPGGAALLKALEALPAQTHALVYIWRVDRLGRETYITLEAENQIMKRRGLIRSTSQTFDITEDFGRFMFNTLASQSGFEKSGIINRMTAGSRTWARRGAWAGGTVPYGYTTEKRNHRSYLIPDETPIPGVNKSPADVVRYIFRTIAEEKVSSDEIAKRLAAMNVPTSHTYRERKGHERNVWRNSTIRYLATQSIYKGQMQYGRRSRRTDAEIITVEMPALVTPELWEDVQVQLRRNQLDAVRSAKTQYLLRGIIKCGLCGRGCHGTMHRKKLRYLCNGYISNHFEFGPGGTRGERCPVRIDGDIEDHVWAEIERFLANPEDEIMARLSTSRKADEIPALQTECDALQALIDDKEAEKLSILRLFRAQVLTDDDVALQFEDINQQKATLTSQHAALQKRIDTASALLRQRDEATEKLLSIKKFLSTPPTWEEKREVIKMLVQSIVVTGTPRTPYTGPGGRSGFEAKAAITYWFDASADV